MAKYLAHIREDGREQSVLEHLEGTAELAGEFAAAFGCEELGAQTALLHDIGKYSNEFQLRIREGGHRCDHSTAGAREALKLKNPFMALAIAGHHGGLPDCGKSTDTAGESTLRGRSKKKLEDYDAFRGEQTPPAKSAPLPSWLNERIPNAPIADCLFARMLFSSLVDADGLDTEAFMQGDTGRGGYESLSALYDRLMAGLTDFLTPPPDASELNRRRSAILNACKSAGKWPQDLFTLTVPTGGGKTLSSLAFALAHAKEHDLRRVIYVIPYTSIIEQNAAVFEQYLGSENVVQHHSALSPAEAREDGDAQDAEDAAVRKKRLAAENWDAPVIVTTAVQFFESLFSNRVSRCRKLHNIAGSIVIFDEAQMLPVNLLAPCVGAIAALVRHFGVSAVLCTATQPALEKTLNRLVPGIEAREICPDAAAPCFERVVFKQEGPLSDEELSARLMNEHQALAIVNSRAQAQAIYALLEGEGRYHLSTLIIPKARRAKLDEIRRRLDSGLPCRVVSTSLIEAGVDVDFPAVYRAEAGLDSILQAAGRCNRNAKNPAVKGVVHIFTTDRKPPQSMKKNIESYHVALSFQRDIASETAIHAYFSDLYDSMADARGFGNLDAKDILPLSRDCAFAEIGQRFRLIEDNTRTVYVPWDEEGKSLTERLEKGEMSRELLRRLGQYAVSVYPDTFDALKIGLLLPDTSERWGILFDMDLYSDEMGLSAAREPAASLLTS